MAASPDQLTEEIAATRQRMGSTLDQVGPRVDPRQAVERRKPRMRAKVEQIKDTIMGSAQDTAGRVADGAGSVGDRVASGTEGNPLAMGIVAFGAGMLAGSVLPSSRTEARAVHELQDQLEQPVQGAIRESAGEIRERVGDRAGDAVETTRQRASEATSNVADSAQDSAEHVKDESRAAAQDVRRDIEGS